MFSKELGKENKNVEKVIKAYLDMLSAITHLQPADRMVKEYLEGKRQKNREIEKLIEFYKILLGGK